MSITLNELPPVSSWQAVLALAPALLATAGALGASRTNAAAAWRTASRIAALALVAALLSLVGLLALGSGAAWGVRIDAPGGIVTVLVALIGWVIVRYSEPCLAGQRGSREVCGYVRHLLTTLAAVLVVVSTNHLLVLALAWMATSLALHRLLTFFNERQPALNAAHKKFVLGRAADIAMLLACALLATAFGTLQIDSLLAQASAATTLPLTAQAAMVLVVLAALLKCAQLPFHGWLIQVMEAPTPVSALLHAGVVNLGGFVLIRLAPLVAEAPLATGLLVVAGAFTAVVAALVMTTRISVKVALAWSTCAQMGFMLVQCGLGLWEMALLHLVAHSLYKAHAFLNAGSVVRQTLVKQLAPAAAPAKLSVQLLSGLGALVAAAAMAWMTGLRPDEQPALWVMGGVLALALTPLLPTSTRGGAGPLPLLRSTVAACVLAGLWFGLHALLQGWVAPARAVPDAPWWLVAAAAFGLLFVLQCVVTARPQGALARRLYPWFYGGLFLDERFSRAVFGLWPPPRPAVQASAKPRAAWPQGAAPIRPHEQATTAVPPQLIETTP